MISNLLKSCLVFLLLINISINSSGFEELKISNFDEVTYPVGITNFSYQFSPIIIPEDRAPNFFFNFTDPEKY